MSMIECAPQLDWDDFCLHFETMQQPVSDLWREQLRYVGPM